MKLPLAVLVASLAAAAAFAGTASASSTATAQAHWNCAGLAHSTAPQAKQTVKLAHRFAHDHAVARHLSRAQDPPDDGGICDQMWDAGDPNWAYCVWYYYYGGGGGGGGGC